MRHAVVAAAAAPLLPPGFGAVPFPPDAASAAAAVRPISLETVDSMAQIIRRELKVDAAVRNAEMHINAQFQ